MQVCHGVDKQTVLTSIKIIFKGFEGFGELLQKFPKRIPPHPDKSKFEAVKHVNLLENHYSESEKQITPYTFAFFGVRPFQVLRPALAISRYPWQFRSAFGF